MPQIKEYVSRTETTGATETRAPSQAALQVGRAIQGAGDQMMQVGDLINKRQEQAEVSDLGAQIAQVQADHTISWQDRMQKGLQGATTGDNSGHAATEGSADDPEKPGMAEQFVSDYDQKMAAISEKINTRAGRLYFDQQNSHLRREFQELAFHGQAELAGAKTKANFQTILNAQSSSLIANPSAFPASAAMLENTINTMVANEHLPAKDAEALRVTSKGELAQQAVRGWIRNSPEEAEAQLNSGKWDSFLSGDAKHQLYGELKTEVAGRKSNFEYQELLRKKELKENQDKAQNVVLNKIYEGGASVKDILHGDGAILDPDKKESLIKVMQARQKEPEHANPAVLRNMVDRIHADEGDPRKITTEDQLLKIYTSGGATWEQFQQGRQELSGKKSIQGQADAAAYKRLLREAEATLVRKDPMGLPDPNGVANYNNYVSALQSQISDARKAGKPLGPLLTPGSKDYLGAQLGGYKKTSQQIMQETMQRMRDANKKATAPTNPDLKPEAISVMDMAGLKTLDNRGLTKEQRKAARDRYDALKTGAK